MKGAVTRLASPHCFSCSFCFQCQLLVLIRYEIREIEKFLANDKITPFCQTNVSQALNQTFQTTKMNSETLLD